MSFFLTSMPTYTKSTFQSTIATYELYVKRNPKSMSSTTPDIIRQMKCYNEALATVSGPDYVKYWPREERTLSNMRSVIVNFQKGRSHNKKCFDGLAQSISRHYYPEDVNVPSPNTPWTGNKDYSGYAEDWELLMHLSIASGLSLAACTNLLVDVGMKQDPRHLYFNVELQVLQNLFWIPMFKPEKADSPLKFDVP